MGKKMTDNGSISLFEEFFRKMGAFSNSTFFLSYETFSVIECKWGHFDTCPTTKLISLDYQMLLTNFSSRWKSPVLFVDRVDRNP